MLLLVLEFAQVSTFTLVVMLAWEKLVHGIFHQVSVCSNCTLTKHLNVTVYKKGGYLDVGRCERLCQGIHVESDWRSEGIAWLLPGLGTLCWLINYVWLYILSFFYYTYEWTTWKDRIVGLPCRCMSKKIHVCQRNMGGLQQRKVDLRYCV